MALSPVAWGGRSDRQTAICVSTGLSLSAQQAVRAPALLEGLLCPRTRWPDTNGTGSSEQETGLAFLWARCRGLARGGTAPPTPLPRAQRVGREVWALPVTSRRNPPNQEARPSGQQGDALPPPGWPPVWRPGPVHCWPHTPRSCKALHPTRQDWSGLFHTSHAWTGKGSGHCRASPVLCWALSSLLSGSRKQNKANTLSTRRPPVSPSGH